MNYIKTIYLPGEEQVRNHETKKVYLRLQERLAELSLTFNDPEWRTSVDVNHQLNPNAGSEVFEWLTPCFSIRLHADDQGLYYISYSVNKDLVSSEIQASAREILRKVVETARPGGLGGNLRPCIHHSLYSERHYQEAYDRALGGRDYGYAITRREFTLRIAK